MDVGLCWDWNRSLGKEFVITWKFFKASIMVILELLEVRSEKERRLAAAAVVE